MKPHVFDALVNDKHLCASEGSIPAPEVLCEGYKVTSV